MEENNIKKNNNIIFYVVAICMILIVGIGVGYYFYNSNNNVEKPTENNKPKENNIDEKVDESSYIKITDNKKVLKSDLNVSPNAEIYSSKVDSINGLVFLDIIEPDFQFETHYLLCYDKDGKLILDIRDIKDKDNGNNRYKYNGKFSYDESKKTLSFYTNVFLGESDDASGASFDEKGISELTSSEKKILGNYSDTVKYEYKYENKKMNFVKKEEISKLKDNSYYRNILG